MPYFDPKEPEKMRLAHTIAQNVRCKHCGEAWKEHAPVATPEWGAGACPIKKREL